MKSLPLTNSWHMVFLEGNEVALLFSEDMKCAFYLFSLSESWLPYTCFSKRISRRDAGLSGPPDEVVVVALRVVPMGWHSATGLIQHAHRHSYRTAIGVRDSEGQTPEAVLGGSRWNCWQRGSSPTTRCIFSGKSSWTTSTLWRSPLKLSYDIASTRRCALPPT